MGLLDKIHTKLDAPVPVPVPAPKPAAVDNILDMDVRDEFIRDTMAVAGSPVKQQELWDRYKAAGTNMITLHAAVKAICKSTDALLIEKYGIGSGDAVELKTAAEWAANSNYSKLYK